MWNIKSFLAVCLSIAVALAGLGLAHARGQVQAPPSRANVYVYPHKLTPKDRVTFGCRSFVEIKSETTLIWVDLQPDARFGHATELILTSVEGTRILKGNTWPTINGKDFRPDGGEEYQVAFPLQVSEPQPNGYLKRTNVFVYPHKLTAKDKVGMRQDVAVKGETTLIWVDLQPGARYGHGTELILISAEGSSVVKGHWWPTINGKDFRPEENVKYQVAFPLQVTGN